MVYCYGPYSSRFVMHIAIIGAGVVGATTAYTLAIKNIAAHITLIDINTKREEGEVMDIGDTLSLIETGLVHGGQFHDAGQADIIILTAGAAQQPGETRLDLAQKNSAITKQIFRDIGRLKRDAIVLVVTNPVDIITMTAQRATRLPAGQVFGSGTTLDTARLKRAVGARLGVSPQNVHGYVLGEHGDSEFVAWSTVTIGGVSIRQVHGLTAADARQIEASVRHGAYEIIERKGATYYGIASVVANIIESIVFDQHLILSVSAELTDWNGISGVALGAPAVIGRRGVERHWPLSLSRTEKRQLEQSAGTIRNFLA